MPGPLGHLRHRKRKNTTETKNNRKAVASSKRKRMKSSSSQSPQQSTSEVGGKPGKASHISCECHHADDRWRCSASPESEGPEGKENELRAELVASGSRLNRIQSDEEADKPVFPDDDSNQILPVEQFFGNMETVQDVPQRNPATSARVRKEIRKRHFYASEDTDE